MTGVQTCALPILDKALIVSCISVAISLFALGWNFYRDVILKSRAHGHISISHIVHGDKKLGPYILISFVNLGPGKLIIESIYIAKLPKVRILGKRICKLLNRTPEYAHIMWDYTNSYSSKLPASIDVGEKITLPLESNQSAFLAVDPTHVGVTDSFGRFHWVSSSSLALAKKEFFKKYEKRPWGPLPPESDQQTKH